MKKILLLFLLCVVFISGCTIDNQEENNENPSNQALNEILISAQNYSDNVALAQSVAPAIVGITSADSSGESVGSGVCVASGGYILTNSHVILNPNQITLHLYNGNTASGNLIWEDTVQDIAIIKSNATLPYLPLGEVDNISVGEDVLAVGTPITLTLKHTFTKGIVSALNRTLKINSLGGESYMQNLIQHDASLNPGNSGGPIINSRGEVVGINTLKISGGEGIGFAIPVKSIASVLNNVVQNISYITPYLGVYGYDSEIANYYQLTTQNKGVYILDISANSPLNSFGIKKGDIITSINGENINNMLDLRHELYKYQYGDKIEVGYERNDLSYITEISLEKRV